MDVFDHDFDVHGQEYGDETDAIASLRPHTGLEEAGAVGLSTFVEGIAEEILVRLGGVAIAFCLRPVCMP